MKKIEELKKRVAELKLKTKGVISNGKEERSEEKGSEERKER